MSAGNNARSPAPIAPRGLKGCEVAAYLGLSSSSFVRKRRAMIRAGFPPSDPLTGRYDRHAIDAWLDARAGLGGNAGERELLRRLGGGPGAP